MGLLQKDDAHGRIVRWQVCLAEYDIEYIHIPGKENVLADGMSRMRCINGSGKELEVETILEVCEVEREELASEWREWLEDKWYWEVVYYKLFGDLNDFKDENGTPLSARQRRLIRHKAKPYRLLPHSTDLQVAKRLLFIERNGKEAYCVCTGEVESILYRLHDCHGHFAAGVLLRTIMGRNYWPTRVRDVNLYWVTCTSCQMIGPLKPSVS